MTAAVPQASSGTPIETDAVVVGAGPVGLFQVFQLGLHGVRSQLIDSLPVVGGQCIELYPDKPIYDIPGTPRCTGRELVAQLQKQIEPFAPPLHLAQQVDVLAREADGRFRIETSTGVRLLARVVVVAGGVGSFQPRRLKVDGLALHEGTQVFHRRADSGALAGRRVVIVGDDDGALECAIALAGDGPERAGRVTLMHRRDEFKATVENVATLQRLREAGRVEFVAAQATGVVRDGDRLAALQVSVADGATRTLELDTLLVLTGLSPKLGPIAGWGLALERKQIVVDTERFETSVAGVFAVGDVNTYPGKRKLILCGFHEAALAAFAAAALVFPDVAHPLEYTTTSARLHRALGIAPEAGQ